MPGDDPLIRASQLNSLRDARTADVVIIEASWGTLAEAGDYRQGHIPGAIHLDTDDLENEYPRWLLRPPNELHEVLGQSRIASTTKVVVYGPHANAASHIYTRPDGRLRPLDDIRTLWQHAAICSTTDPSRFDREVVFYCGSGWRSSLAFFFAWWMGYRNICNYSDGFCGWSTRYEPDAHAEGSTPGWRQEPTDNPIVTAAR